MDVVGSEIGQKMRSAIKAKLTELGCYVDDELPDYVMVMVANKRTRAQMEDDLQLFLGDNTELFVNWLHQVLKKLQEVTVTPAAAKTDAEKSKENPKEKKSKDKKDKVKAKLKKVESAKKAKKKGKEKEKHRKKEEKKSHKKKHKDKHHDEIIRPNIPPLLMNIEKESEPSITDVFAGQILKNHGVLIETPKEEKPEVKPDIREAKKPILPIIDPATITAQVESTEPVTVELDKATGTTAAPREEQIKEMNEIEAKIQGLKQKLAEQLDSMSEDEDFLNIRTEAEELMNDFAEDVFQEISSQAPVVATPPITKSISLSPTPPPPKSSEPIEPPKVSEPPTVPEPEPEPTPPPKVPEPETLPQIELKLPKRPVRERLGAKEEKKKIAEEIAKEDTSNVEKRHASPERLTPEREPDFWGRFKSAKSRLGSPPEPTRKSPVTFKRKSVSDDSDSSDSSFKRERKRSSSRNRVSCASVVRVKPRVRTQPASSLLLRAVADAHKSLLNIPPKVETEPAKIKRALVLPMRRGLDAQNIVIQVPAERHKDRDASIEREKEEYIPAPLSKKIVNNDYVPSRRADRSASKRDDSLIIDTLNIHNPTVGKDKNTQFIVTMDGFNPNAFLAKKLKTEGLLDEDLDETPKEAKSVLKIPPVAIRSTDHEKTKDADKNTNKPDITTKPKISDKIEKTTEIIDKENKERQTEEKNKENEDKNDEKESPQKKRLSDTSDDSDINVIIKAKDDKEAKEKVEKRKSLEDITEEAPSKKRKASPIVFDASKKEKEDRAKEKEILKRERTESASSDNHVVVTTNPSLHKYDAVPPLSAAEKKAIKCRSFPLCRFGAACAFQHPLCKFSAACTRRNCPYSHCAVASTVVPAANFKSITSLPSVCMYYPNCTNPTCHYYHPKPCRYGKACANKLECNFYHHDLPGKWRYPV